MTRACFSRSACACRDIASCSASGMVTSRISTEFTETPQSAVLRAISARRNSSADCRSDKRGRGRRQSREQQAETDEAAYESQEYRDRVHGKYLRIARAMLPGLAMAPGRPRSARFRVVMGASYQLPRLPRGMLILRLRGHHGVPGRLKYHGRPRRIRASPKGDGAVHVGARADTARGRCCLTARILELRWFGEETRRSARRPGREESEGRGSGNRAAAL